jgi:hypothetical protein
MKKSSFAPLALAASLALATGGCAILTPKTETTPVEAKKVAEAIGNMKTRTADTCPTRQDAAELNSRIDTIKTGRETVYKADCAAAAKAKS